MYVRLCFAFILVYLVFIALFLSSCDRLCFPPLFYETIFRIYCCDFTADEFFNNTNNNLSLHTQDRTFMLTSAYHFAVNSLRLHSAVVIVVGLCNERC